MSDLIERLENTRTRVAYLCGHVDDWSTDDYAFADNAEEAAQRIKELTEALEYLIVESRGCLYLSGVREAIGNTNFACLELRLKNAAQALQEPPK